MEVKPGLVTEYAHYVEINSDPYSRAVVTYTERWADLMEPRIAAGETVAAIADETSHTADTEGITGFMYGCAASALAKFWVHGDELLKWHNRQYIKDETKADEATARGGVVNPAIWTVADPNEQ